MSQPAFDFGDEPVDDPANPTYTVAELADALNASLRRGFNEGVWVRGEIQGWSERNQHAYFRLADDTAGVKAVLNVQFFANARMKLRPMLQKHRLRLADGMKVRVFGYLDFYAPAGQLGLKMADLDPRFTLGDLAAQRDETIRRLVAEGLLDANKRTVVSPIPLHVGVVSSVDTAAWHDFHDELVRSSYGFHLRVCDVRVQGPTAARGISRAIVALSARRDLDAIVVIRGGGARNELATFDAEPIARAIAAAHAFRCSPGSATRSTAAWRTRPPTPRSRHRRRARRRWSMRFVPTWSRASDRGARSARCRSVTSGVPPSSSPAAPIGSPAAPTMPSSGPTNASRFASRRSAREHHALAAAQARVDDIATRLVRRPHQLLAAEDRHLASLQARLGLLDPVNLLARGWSITRTADGRVVRSVSGAPPGAIIHTAVADGTVTSRVEETS